MKILVQKFAGGGSQIGGRFAQYAASFTPIETQVTTPSRQSTTTTTKESTKDDLGLKDLVKVFDNVKGLTNDVDYTMSKFANSIANKILVSYDGELSPYELVTSYYSSLADFNRLNNSIKQYDSVRNKLQENNALNETAITPHGELVVLTEDGLDSVSIQEYSKNPRAYKVLTNNDVLALRDKNPNLAFRDDILTELSGVGMDKIIGKINNLVTNLGTSKREQIVGETQAIKNGIDLIQNLSETGQDINELINGSARQEIITEQQQEEAKAALSAVLQLLNPQEQALLNYRSLQNGGSGMVGVLSDLISSRISDRVRQVQITSRQLGTTTSKKATTEGGTTLKDEHDNPLQDLINLQGGIATPVYFVTSSGNEAMITQGVHWSKLTEKDPGATSLSNMLNKTGIGGVIRSYGGITFGDIQVPSEFLKDIMYKEGGGTVAILPAKYDTMGNQMVDLSLLDEFKEITSSVTQYTQGTNEWWAEVNKKIKEKGLGQFLLGDGSIDKKQFGTFLIVEGYTTDTILKNINPAFKESHYMENEGNREDILNFMKEALSPDGGTTKYEVDTFNILNPLDWFGVDDVYHASVFLPLTNNNLQAVNAWGQTINETSALRKQADYQADYSNKLDRNLNAGSDVLNQ